MFMNQQQSVDKQYGEPTTEDDVTGAVTIPDYPADKEQPTITVDDHTYQMVIHQVKQK